jgi:GNAT superfamily N-acetyltransferase
MRFSIRAARPEDAGNIAVVHVAGSLSTYRGIIPDAALAKYGIADRTRQWETRLKEPEPNTCTFVATDKDEGDAIAGFANAGPVRTDELKSDAELYAIYLLQQYRRMGIGKALMREVEAFLRSAGFRSMGLWVLEVSPARGFYEALGGRIVARTTIEREGIVLGLFGYKWELVAQ